MSVCLKVIVSFAGITFQEVLRRLEKEPELAHFQVKIRPGDAYHVTGVTDPVQSEGVMEEFREMLTNLVYFYEVRL